MVNSACQQDLELFANSSRLPFETRLALDLGSMGREANFFDPFDLVRQT